ncbi:pseudouridine synthase [Nannocystaceae bacterium ST9]
MPRLDQLLARNLGCSRKEATKLLRGGAVRDAEGIPIRDGRAELPAGEIEVEGERVRLRERMHLMQHKPAGVVTSRKDGIHPTAWALLRDAPLHAELLAIGRLDLDATGLLLWTTEGPAVHALTHPRRAVSREYQVALARPFASPPRDHEGQITLELDEGYRPIIVALAELADADRHVALPLPEGTSRLARVVLRSGAFHEVKRIFAALGSEVLALTRTEHAGLRLPDDLEPGGWRELEDLPT